MWFDELLAAKVPSSRHLGVDLLAAAEYDLGILQQTRLGDLHLVSDSDSKGFESFVTVPVQGLDASHDVCLSLLRASDGELDHGGGLIGVQLEVVSLELDKVADFHREVSAPHRLDEWEVRVIERQSPLLLIMLEHALSCDNSILLLVELEVLGSGTSCFAKVFLKQDPVDGIDLVIVHLVAMADPKLQLLELHDNHEGIRLGPG